MLDHNVLLKAQGAQPVNALFAATQAADQSAQNKINRDLGQEKIKAAQNQNAADEQRREHFSITKGAIDTLGFIENNDVQGLDQYYAARQAEIEARGGNAQDTIEARRILQSGDIGSLKQRATQVVSGAERLGLIKTQGNENSLSKSFQQGVDEDGNLIFFRGGSRGGVERLDGINPVDPTQRKIEEQNRLQTETPQGIAATQKAEANAREAEFKAKEKEDQKTKGRKIKSSALQLINDLLSDREATLSVFGAYDSRTPTLLPAATDAEAKLEQLADILTSDNLGLMSGVLSETDLKVIANIAGGGLNRKLSDEQALKNLRELQRSFSSEVGESGAPVEGARLAPDGAWYVERDGQFFRVEQ